jgi:hypothetical protein
LVLKANQNDWFDDLSESEKAEIQIGLDQAERRFNKIVHYLEAK